MAHTYQSSSKMMIKTVFTSAFYSSQDSSYGSLIKSYLSLITGAFFKWPYKLLNTQTITVVPVCCKLRSMWFSSVHWTHSALGFYPSHINTLKNVSDVTCFTFLLERGNMLSSNKAGVQKVVSEHVLDLTYFFWIHSLKNRASNLACNHITPY
jgi:hypothetical protein